MTAQRRLQGDRHLASHSFKALLALVYGIGFLATALWLAFKGSPLDGQRFEIVGIVLAFVSGDIATRIPGFLGATIKPIMKSTLRSAGILVALIFLYFLSPAHWRHSESTVSQQTSGSASPA